jgi:hypothetical protein
MPHYMLMFVGSEDRRNTAQGPTPEVGKWWDANHGVIKGGARLDTSKNAMTVRRINGQMKVSDGPFVEAKETVGGYCLVDVPDLDAAIKLAKSWPAGDVEVRPTVEH